MIMISKIIICCFAVVLCLSFVFSVSSGALIDPLSEGVKTGLNSWIIEMCDSVYAIGVDEVNTTNADVISEGIFRASTYSYNPFDNEGVKNIALWSVCFWGVGIIIYLLFGLFMVIVSRGSNDASQALAFITKVNTEHTLKQYFKNAMIGVFAPVFIWVLCGAVLILNYILTAMVMLSVLPAVGPTPDNVPVYVMMAGLYFFMMLFFAYRFLYINLFVGFALLIVLLYIFSVQTRMIAIFLSAGFVMVVFMQFVTVAVTAAGVLSIQASINSGVIPPNGTMLIYAALLIILTIVGFSMTIGLWFLRKLIFAGATAVKLVI